MKTRKEIKALAREALRAQRDTSILLGFVYFLLVTAFMVVPSGLLALIVRAGRRSFALAGLPVYMLVHLAAAALLLVMAVGLYGAYLKVYRGEPVRVRVLFSALKVHFFRKLGGLLWMVLWIMLWGAIAYPALFGGAALLGLGARAGAGVSVVLGFSLLFASPLLLIPMIIKALSYFATPFILADCPDVGAREALRLSKRVTKGYVGKLFMLKLSFIGWAALSCLTFGILGIVFVFPYLYLSLSGFYTELRDKAIIDGVITREEIGLEPDDPSET